MLQHVTRKLNNTSLYGCTTFCLSTHPLITVFRQPYWHVIHTPDTWLLPPAGAACLVVSCVRLFVTPWTAARQAPLSMGFSRQEYSSGLACPPPGGSSQPRARTRVSQIAGRFLTVWATRETQEYWSEWPIPSAVSRKLSLIPHLHMYPLSEWIHTFSVVYNHYCT